MKKITMILCIALAAIMVVSVFASIIDFGKSESKDEPSSTTENPPVSSEGPSSEGSSEVDTPVVDPEPTYPDGHIPAELDTSVYTLYSEDTYTVCKSLPEGFEDCINTAQLYYSTEDDGSGNLNTRLVLKYDLQDWKYFVIHYGSSDAAPSQFDISDLAYSVNGVDWFALSVETEGVDETFVLENCGYEDLYITVCYANAVDSYDSLQAAMSLAGELAAEGDINLYICGYPEGWEPGETDLTLYSEVNYLTCSSVPESFEKYSNAATLYYHITEEYGMYTTSFVLRYDLEDWGEFVSVHYKNTFLTGLGDTYIAVYSISFNGETWINLSNVSSEWSNEAYPNYGYDHVYVKIGAVTSTNEDVTSDLEKVASHLSGNEIDIYITDN